MQGGWFAGSLAGSVTGALLYVTVNADTWPFRTASVPRARQRWRPAVRLRRRAATSERADRESLHGDGDALALSILLGRVSHGDQDAFGRFYDATSHLVFGMALSVISDKVVAEAVTQEVYVAAWRAAPAFDPSQATASAWLTDIAETEIRLLTKLLAP